MALWCHQSTLKGGSQETTSLQLRRIAPKEQLVLVTISSSAVLPRDVTLSWTDAPRSMSRQSLIGSLSLTRIRAAHKRTPGRKALTIRGSKEEPQKSRKEEHARNELGHPDKVTQDRSPVARSVVEIPDAIFQEHQTDRKQQDCAKQINCSVATAYC
jgi:hypothetical protein